MQGRPEEKRILKAEPVRVSSDIARLVDSINKRRPIFDERLCSKVAESAGIRTCDAKVFKLFSALVEHYVDDLLTSINHKSHREIMEIDEKLAEAQKDNSGITRDQHQEKTDAA